MNIVEKLEQVIASNIIGEELLFAPSKGISKEKMLELDIAFNNLLSEDLKSLLRKWNGLHLDIINFFGFGDPLEGSINSMEENQLKNYHVYNYKDFLAFADDPAAYLYLQSPSGEIYTFDLKNSYMDRVSSSLEDFICNYVFGKRAAEFAGDEWFDEVKAAGLIDD
jgi:hypothetical protein